MGFQISTTPLESGEDMSEKPARDVERGYSNAEFVAKLRRLEDSIESSGRFEIQIGGERIYVPASARFTESMSDQVERRRSSSR